MLTFQHAQFNNGLNIIVELNDTAQSTALGFMVKTGARDEAADVSGVSHFLEHMMFKGTAGAPASRSTRNSTRWGRKTTRSPRTK